MRFLTETDSSWAPSTHCDCSGQRPLLHWASHLGTPHPCALRPQLSQGAGLAGNPLSRAQRPAPTSPHVLGAKGTARRTGLVTQPLENKHELYHCQQVFPPYSLLSSTQQGRGREGRGRRVWKEEGSWELPRWAVAPSQSQCSEGWRMGHCDRVNTARKLLPGRLGRFGTNGYGPISTCLLGERRPGFTPAVTTPQTMAC